jgi:hypothetical protein
LPFGCMSLGRSCAADTGGLLIEGEEAHELCPTATTSQRRPQAHPRGPIHPERRASRTRGIPPDDGPRRQGEVGSSTSESVTRAGTTSRNGSWIGGKNPDESGWTAAADRRGETQ